MAAYHQPPPAAFHPYAPTAPGLGHSYPRVFATGPTVAPTSNGSHYPPTHTHAFAPAPTQAATQARGHGHAAAHLSPPFTSLPAPAGQPLAPASSWMPGQPAGPVKAACLSCRQKKAKCDGVQPVCGQCDKKAIECIYIKSKRGGARKKRDLTAPTALAQFLAKLDGLMGIPEFTLPKPQPLPNDDPTNVVRTFGSRDEILRCYYTEVHPYIAVLPPRQYLAEVSRELLPESPFLLAVQTVITLYPHALDSNPKSDDSRRMRNVAARNLAERTHALVMSNLMRPDPIKTVENVQALMILSIYEWGAVGHLPTVRDYYTLATEAAMDMGMHQLDRGATEAFKMEGIDWRADMLRRTWWFTYAYQLTMALVSAAPPRIQPDDSSVEVAFPVCSAQDRTWSNWINMIRMCYRVVLYVNTVVATPPSDSPATASSSGGINTWGHKQQAMDDRDDRAYRTRKMIEIDRNITTMMKEAERLSVIEHVPGGEEEVARNLQVATRLGLAVTHIHVHRHQAFPEVSFFSKAICGLPETLSAGAGAARAIEHIRRDNAKRGSVSSSGRATSDETVSTNGHAVAGTRPGTSPLYADSHGPSPGTHSQASAASYDLTSLDGSFDAADVAAQQRVLEEILAANGIDISGSGAAAANSNFGVIGTHANGAAGYNNGSADYSNGATGLINAAGATSGVSDNPARVFNGFAAPRVQGHQQAQNSANGNLQAQPPLAPQNLSPIHGWTPPSASTSSGRNNVTSQSPVYFSSTGYTGGSFVNGTAPTQLYDSNTDANLQAFDALYVAGGHGQVNTNPLMPVIPDGLTKYDPLYLDGGLPSAEFPNGDFFANATDLLPLSSASNTLATAGGVTQAAPADLAYDFFAHLSPRQVIPSTSNGFPVPTNLHTPPSAGLAQQISPATALSVSPALAYPPTTGFASQLQYPQYDLPFLGELWEPELYPSNMPMPWFAQPGGAASLYYPIEELPKHAPPLPMLPETSTLSSPPHAVQPAAPATATVPAAVAAPRTGSSTSAPSGEAAPGPATAAAALANKARAWGIDDNGVVRDEAGVKEEYGERERANAGGTGASTTSVAGEASDDDDLAAVFAPGLSLQRCATAAHTIVRLEVIHRSATMALAEGPPKWLPFCSCGLVTGAYAFLLLALAVQAENEFVPDPDGRRGREVEALLTNVKIILAGLEAYGVMWGAIDMMATEVRNALESATNLSSEVRAQITNASPATEAE
ncbi:hypothetical protein Q5752_000029 [Cryptotrichosporon argae]